MGFDMRKSVFREIQTLETSYKIEILSVASLDTILSK